MPQRQKTNAVSTFLSNAMYTEQKISNSRKIKIISKLCEMEFYYASRLYIVVDKFDFLSS